MALSPATDWENTVSSSCHLNQRDPRIGELDYEAILNFQSTRSLPPSHETFLPDVTNSLPLFPSVSKLLTIPKTESSPDRNQVPGP